MATPAAPKHNRTDGKDTSAAGLTPCLGGGGVLPRQKLLRFVAGPDGQIYLDLNHELPGMGAYVRPGLSFLEKAISSKALENTLDAKYQGTAADLHAMALKVVEKQLLNRLGLMRKAGQLMTGTDKVLEALYQGKMQCLLIAVDAAANTMKKVTLACENAHAKCLTVCERSLLEGALGKDNCTVIGLSSRANINEVHRLATLWHGLKGLQNKA